MLLLLIKVSVKERQEHSILTRSALEIAHSQPEHRIYIKIIILNGCVTWKVVAERGRGTRKDRNRTAGLPLPIPSSYTGQAMWELQFISTHNEIELYSSVPLHSGHSSGILCFCGGEPLAPGDLIILKRGECFRPLIEVCKIVPFIRSICRLGKSIPFWM